MLRERTGVKQVDIHPSVRSSRGSRSGSLLSTRRRLRSQHVSTWKNALNAGVHALTHTQGTFLDVQTLLSKQPQQGTRNYHARDRTYAGLSVIRSSPVRETACLEPCRRTHNETISFGTSFGFMFAAFFENVGTKDTHIFGPSPVDLV